MDLFLMLLKLGHAGASFASSGPPLFTHLSDRAGLKVLRHQAFGWAGRWRSTDALTVVERPDVTGNNKHDGGAGSIGL